MLRYFIIFCIRVLRFVTAHPERPRRDFHKTQQRVVRQKPGVFPETEIAQTGQRIACINPFQKWPVWILERLQQDINAPVPGLRRPYG